MQSAFVDIGLEKAAFLHASDIVSHTECVDSIFLFVNMTKTKVEKKDSVEKLMNVTRMALRWWKRVF